MRVKVHAISYFIEYNGININDFLTWRVDYLVIISINLDKFYNRSVYLDE